MYIKDAKKPITNILFECEHTFYTKQFTPCITDPKTHNDVSTDRITKAITAFFEQIVNLSSTQRKLRQSTDMINTQYTSMSDRINKHYFQFDRMEREFKTIDKKIHVLDRKFTMVSPESINQQASSLTTELAALTQHHANDQPSLYLPTSRKILLYHTAFKPRIIALINLMKTINYSVTFYSRCGTPSPPIPAATRTDRLITTFLSLLSLLQSYRHKRQHPPSLVASPTYMIRNGIFNSPPWPVSPHLW